MKWVIWTIGGVLATLWTGALAMLALFVDWAGRSLQQAGSTAQQLPVELPDWLAGWIDPAGWATMSQAIQQSLQTLQSMLPVIGTATGWLEPLVWIVWGFGMIALFGVAIGSHWWAGRRAVGAGFAG